MLSQRAAIWQRRRRNFSLSTREPDGERTIAVQDYGQSWLREELSAGNAGDGYGIGCEIMVNLCFSVKIRIVWSYQRSFCEDFVRLGNDHGCD